MPVDIKLQFVAGNEIRTDLRGDKFIGKDQGDHHKTIAEIENVDEATVELALTELHEANEAAAKLLDIASRFGIPKDRILKGLSIIMGEDVTDAEYAALQLRVYSHD